MAGLRKALGDDSKSPALVVTVARRGYRFAADTQDLEAPSAHQPKGLYPRWWLTWHDTPLPLREGASPGQPFPTGPSTMK